MADLFLTTKQNISLHINNIFNEDELIKNSVVKESLTTAKDGKRYKTNFYNLDVIISVGYRVKSKRGTKFRQWANRVLKEYIIRGYVLNRQIRMLEDRMESKFLDYDSQIMDLKNKVDFFVRSSLPPVEGIFFDGQIFDAYVQIVDDVVYLFGASLKDAGKKLFAYIKMQETPAAELLFFVSHGDGHLGHAGSTAKKTGRASRLTLSIPVLLFNLQKNFFTSEKGSFL